MKQILVVALGIFIFSSCTTSQTEDTQYNLYRCEVPAEIVEIAPGQDIYWDCSWQASYNNGRVKLIKSDSGNLVAISRTKPSVYEVDSVILVTTP